MIEKKDVKIYGLAKELQGLNTIESICKKAGIKKKTAILTIIPTEKTSANISTAFIFCTSRLY